MSPNQTKHNLSNHHCSSGSVLYKFQAPTTINLYKEEERLKTFRNWSSIVLRPDELAEDGFYFTGSDDVVRCVFCGIEIGQWEEGDVVRRDHARWAPDCDFVRGRPCGNVPKGDDQSEVASPSSSTSSSPPSYDECGPYGHLIRPYSGPERACDALPPNFVQDLEHLGVSRTNKPCHPKYSTINARLKTFYNWPAQCPVSPSALAEAGFYYNGNLDEAVCFHCGGGLKNWEEDDDPWVEHARWFSRCGFVQMQKGRDFVVNASKNAPAVLSAEAVGELLEQQNTESTEELSESPIELKRKGEDVKSVVSVPPTSFESEKNIQDSELCRICYMQERAIVFLPCGHLVSCPMCASSLSKCPVCRKPFAATVRAYLS